MAFEFLNKKHKKKQAATDAHGLSGNGVLGRIGKCSVCKRDNKTVGPLSAPSERQKCIVPIEYAAQVAKGKAEIKTGCEIQRGSRPGELVAERRGNPPRDLTNGEYEKKVKRRKMQKQSRRKNRVKH